MITVNRKTMRTTLFAALVGPMLLTGTAEAGDITAILGAAAIAELKKCDKGVGTAEGCLGDTGEVVKLLPHHLKPSTITGNMQTDIDCRCIGPNNEVRRFFKGLGF
jgi:hypothetical protein